MNIYKGIPDPNKVYLLNHTYTLWYHSSKTDSWTIESYKKLNNFNDMESFWKIFNNLSLQENDMLFLMKDDILPIWEDKNNRKGKCISCKIKNKHNSKLWTKLCMYYIGYILTNDINDMKLVNGISITIRKYHSIVKLWVSTLNFNFKKIKKIQDFRNLRDLRHDIKK